MLSPATLTQRQLLFCSTLTAQNPSLSNKSRVKEFTTSRAAASCASSVNRVRKAGPVGTLAAAAVPFNLGTSAAVTHRLNLSVGVWFSPAHIAAYPGTLSAAGTLAAAAVPSRLGTAAYSKDVPQPTCVAAASSGMGKASTALSKRLHAFVSGGVQGVFFRSCTKSKATELGLTGWVRNRRDGRVEVMAEGYESDLQQLLTWLHTGSPQADVSGVDVTWGSATGEFDDFDTLWTA